MSELNGSDPVGLIRDVLEELRERPEPNVDEPGMVMDRGEASLVIYTAAGFLADWVHGRLAYTRDLENAARFTPAAAAWLAPRVNGAVLTAEGRLLTLAELLELVERS